MASNPGILSNWPWKPLGNLKYAIVAPWMGHSIYSYMMKGEKERDLTNFMITIAIIFRFLHNLIWISVSRYQTARGFKRVVHRSIEFHQIDRENNWDDQIIMQGILFYGSNMIIPQASNLPLWRSDGIIMTIVLHAGPVEFLYYWLHRALHHTYLYTRYHSHHHSSIVTQPISSVSHPFAETMAYIMLFAIPLLGVVVMGRSCLAALFGYILYIDFMNNLGHCNFEIVPKWLFSAFPPLKYLIYTPSFHSLHHTKFGTNYSLFMPFYDYIYNTMDTCCDELHNVSAEKVKEVFFLGILAPIFNLVSLDFMAIYNVIHALRKNFSSLASWPQSSIWYLWTLWPFTTLFMLCARTFIGERNYINNVNSQTWVIPKFKFQYLVKWQRSVINKVIEEAIVEAERQGCKVLSLGLLNQAEELNGYGELFIKKNPNLKIKLVDGSSLAAAVVLNSIPKGTTQILFTGNLTKVAKAIISILCHSHIQVAVLGEKEYGRIKQHTQLESNVVLAKRYHQKIWLVGDEVREEDQLKAAKGTTFIPFSQFPPKPIRKDCFYYTTPAMLAPTSLKNLDSCENWLPRRVMSAWRIAGIIHALEDWKVNECGDIIFNIQQIWEATLHYGFQPLPISI